MDAIEEVVQNMIENGYLDSEEESEDYKNGNDKKTNDGFDAKSTTTRRKVYKRCGTISKRVDEPNITKTCGRNGIRKYCSY